MSGVMKLFTGLTLLAVTLTLVPAPQAPAAVGTPDWVVWVTSGGLWRVPRPGLPDYSFQITPTSGMRDVRWFLADWDGDGFDTPGASFASGSSFSFRWTDTLPADGSTEVLVVALDQRASGGPGWEPFADNFFGDWDGDGIDTLGRDSTGGRVSLFEGWPDSTSSAMDTRFWFGLGTRRGDIPLAGDWDGDGVDTMAVYRVAESKVYYSNSNPTVLDTAAPTDGQFWFGVNRDIPLVGDWNGDGFDTIGVYRRFDLTIYFRNSLTTGFGSTVPRWTPGPGSLGSPYVGCLELP